MQKITVQDMVYISVCTALTAVCAQLVIPAPIGVPFTMQTFAVFCTLCLLGARNGSISVVIYILLGAIGAPVFAQLQGGIGVLLGSTGGYIVGFLCIAACFSLSERLFPEKAPARLLALVLGLFLCYAFGTAWFMVIYTRSKGAVSLGTALGWCVFPYVIPDLIKLGLGYMLAGRLRKALHLS